jgi:dsDNA-specific endonuclease/ATPase MutS2
MTSDKELKQTSDKLDEQRRELDKSADSLSKKKRQHETAKADARKVQAQIKETLEKIKGEGEREGGIPADATIKASDITLEKYQVRLIVRGCLLVFVVDADEGTVHTNCFDADGRDVGLTESMNLDDAMAEGATAEFVQKGVKEFLKYVNR